MKALHGVTLAVAVLVFILFASRYVTWVDVRKPTVAEEFALSEAETSDFNIRADAGDGDAAFKLALYYHLSARDSTKAEAWFVRSRELGVTEADSWLESMRNPGRKRAPDQTGADK